MKRRNFVRALTAVSAAPALLAQQQPAGQPAPGVPANPTQPVEPPRQAGGELPKFDMAVPDAAAEMMPDFFTAQQFAALRKLCGVLMPAVNKTPGAIEARAPEFLDFLIGHSPADRKQLYRAGLDALNVQARQQFQKPFAEVDDSQAAAILKPLHLPWSYEPPADPLARFLRAAKVDVRTATVNSREYGAVAENAGRRSFGGGLYWYPLD
ncbi:MAG: gluconate 2-dehydrogenase subunit 3 family protein [Acidobacteriota bacterium]|nr:gluconate 2-dehydrogenase subunit 3 family protein [Acidobacteriota bacterium]